MKIFIIVFLTLLTHASFAQVKIIKVQSSAPVYDTTTRYTGLTTIGKAVNDSIALRAAIAANIADILLRLKLSDTAAMLFPYTKGGVTPTSTNTLTNKRWIPRVDSLVTAGTTPAINTDNVDIFKLIGQTVGITSLTTNLTGTPNDGEILEIQITGTAARTITWGSAFVSSTVTLPTTTATTATLTVIFQYYKSSSYGNNKWTCVNYY